MEEKEVLETFEKTGAILHAHFVLSSGRHSDVYMNKDAVYPSTRRTSRLCKAIADHFGAKGLEIEVVAAPAIGGVALIQWTAHHLNSYLPPDSHIEEVLAVYAEDGPEGRKIFRRGYDKLIPGKNVLILDDVSTTGRSVVKIVEEVKNLKGKVVGVALLCNRGGITAKDIGVPELFTLANLPMEAWSEEECPLCEKDVSINTEVGKGREYLAKKAAETKN